MYATYYRILAMPKTPDPFEGLGIAGDERCRR